MAWDLDFLVSSHPMGFKLVSGFVCYVGSIPEKHLPNMVSVENLEEAECRAREYIRINFKKSDIQKAHLLAVWRGNRGGGDYFFYRLNEEELEGIYTISRKLYDNWYNQGETPIFSRILGDDKQEFIFDQPDFASFRYALKDNDTLKPLRNSPSRSTGQLLAIAYVDYLRENFENRGPKQRDGRNSMLLLGKIEEYRHLEVIPEPLYLHSIPP